MIGSEVEHFITHNIAMRLQEELLHGRIFLFMHVNPKGHKLLHRPLVGIIHLVPLGDERS